MGHIKLLLDGGCLGTFTSTGRAHDDHTKLLVVRHFIYKGCSKKKIKIIKKEDGGSDIYI
jgi:hypothetical protein